MNNQAEILNLIENYLEGNLSESERTAFEKRLKTDETLSKTWNLFHETDRVLKDSKALDMESILGDLGNEFAKKHQNQSSSKVVKGRFSVIRLVAIAASVILLIGAFWWFQNSAVNPHDLYANYYEPYSISTTVRSTNPSLQSLLETGQTEYLNGDFNAAIKRFSTLLNQDSLASDDQITAQFYRGLAHLGENNLRQAQSDLESILTDNNHSYTQQVYWYLSLIALKNNDTESAKSHLNEVLKVVSTGKYANLAKRLLEELP